MKKSHLKQILKPIIKECIKEVFLEQGMLSGIIAEVVKGTRNFQPQTSPKSSTSLKQNTPLKFQQQQLEEQRHGLKEERLQHLKEQKTKLLNATGFSSNIFEGTEPMSRGGHPDASKSSGAGPLADVAPSDPGVDISALMGAAGDKWNKLI